MLDKIKIVLSHTTHPGNIGATARAMKVMGLSNLILVNPQHFPSEEATARASNAFDVLNSAKVCSSLEEALTDSRLVVGASARARSLPIKLVTPRQLTEKIAGDRSRTPISILFGTENSGLSNEELHLCHYHVYIPTNPDYSSLNLASAVQLICYEMRLAFAETSELVLSDNNCNEAAINRQQLAGLVKHFRQVMQLTGYLVPELEKQLNSRMNRLLSKADITLSEMNIMRGFLSSVNQTINNLKNKNSKEL